MVVKIETSLTTLQNLLAPDRPMAPPCELSTTTRRSRRVSWLHSCKCNSESCRVLSCYFFLNYIISRCPSGDFRLFNIFQSWAKVRHLYSRPSRLGVARQGSSGFMLHLTGQAVTCQVEGGGILNWWWEPEVGMRHEFYVVAISCY